MAGFDNDVVYGSNVDFTGNATVSPTVLSDGQLLIGATASPHIRVGSLASAGSTVTISTGAGTINLEAGATVPTSFTGNSGVATPAANNINIVTSNSTVTFIGAGSTLTQDFNLTNLVLGSSLPALAGGIGNVGIGQDCLKSLTAGAGNVAVGYLTGDSITSGVNNTLIGQGAGDAITTASNNTAVGVGALLLASTGVNSNNIAIGNLALSGITTGTKNIGIGISSGQQYTAGTETSNIVIGNAGVTGESNVMRLGTQGAANITQTHIAGVINTVSGRVIKVTTPGAYPYTTLITDHLILVDTSSARTITPLASPVTGTLYIIKDNVGSAAANNITVTPSGKNIDGAASSTINVNYGSITIVYNGTQWVIV